MSDVLNGTPLGREPVLAEGFHETKRRRREDEDAMTMTTEETSAM
jgi:hypothetical protein